MTSPPGRHFPGFNEVCHAALRDADELAELHVADAPFRDASLDEAHRHRKRLGRLGLGEPVKSKMRWAYDFGDGWEHDVIVEAIEPMKSDATYPVCLAGKRACPPDDCGGPWGYGNLLAAISDPTHEEHGELTEWLPYGFDADEFDIAEATDMMRSARPLRAMVKD